MVKALIPPSATHVELFKNMTVSPISLPTRSATTFYLGKRQSEGILIEGLSVLGSFTIIDPSTGATPKP